MGMSSSSSSMTLAHGVEILCLPCDLLCFFLCACRHICSTLNNDVDRSLQYVTFLQGCFDNLGYSTITPGQLVVRAMEVAEHA